MADRKQINKYIPPDFDPRKHGSVNKYHGSHPLRERARKMDQGILVIRFEMPFNVWCTHCDAMIGRGTRFNAEKSSAGSYLSTKIWQFRMKCAQCKGVLVIRTDPQIADYVCVEGCRRKIETPGDDAEVIEVMSPEERERMKSDALFRLEHEHLDELRAREKLPALQKLLEMKDEVGLNEYDYNRKMRRMLRERNTSATQERQRLSSVYGSALDWNTNTDREKLYFEEEDSHALKLGDATEEEKLLAAHVMHRRMLAPVSRGSRTSIARSTTIFGKKPTATEVLVKRNQLARERKNTGHRHSMDSSFSSLLASAVVDVPNNDTKDINQQKNEKKKKKRKREVDSAAKSESEAAVKQHKSQDAFRIHGTGLQQLVDEYASDSD